MKALWLVLSLVLFSPLARAADPQHCRPLPTVIPEQSAEYCVYPGTSRDVMYYLHGLGLNAEIWMEDSYYTGILREYWQSRHRPVPTVVSLTFGPAWLLGHKGRAPLGQAGLLDLVLEQWIPMVEKELGGVKGRRLLLGESMGGFNSIQLAMHAPRLFAKVAAICAPMGDGTITPFDSDEDMARYIRSSIAEKYYGKEGDSVLFETAKAARELASAFFADKQEFLEADPVTLAGRKGPFPRSIYLSAGAYDKYLTYEGNRRFAQVLSSRGTRVEWHPQWGGHCVVDIPSVAEYLERW